MTSQNNQFGTSSFIPAVADADTQDGFSNDSPANPTRAAQPNDSALRGASGKGPKPSPDIQKVAGAGPAIAAHSKDANTSGAGEPGASKDGITLWDG